MFRQRISGWLMGGWWCVVSATQSFGIEDGLFAVFDTTMGSFTCELDFQHAPHTVANFVRLAQPDDRGWIDLTSGRIRYEPYYDGVIFHRVISGFMIQGGSPAGNGFDGPGYTFPDEFSAELRHSATGTLSMANSGLNSNGSQFFVTLVPTPHLDDVHSVFGRVVEGLDVVLAIGQVATGDSNKPLTNVVMQSVTILTHGAEAEAFDVGAQILPEVKEQRTALVREGPQWLLQTPPQLDHEYVVYGSQDLQNWSAGEPALYIHPPQEAALDITERISEEGLDAFTVTDVAYPGPLRVPHDLVHTNVTLTLHGYGQLSFQLGPDGTGEWATNFTDPDHGVITDSTWIQSAYSGSLTLFYDWLVPMRFSMAFDTRDAGPIRGTVYVTPSTSVTGSFTIP